MLLLKNLPCLLHSKHDFFSFRYLLFPRNQLLLSLSLFFLQLSLKLLLLFPLVSLSLNHLGLHGLLHHAQLAGFLLGQRGIQLLINFFEVTFQFLYVGVAVHVALHCSLASCLQSLLLVLLFESLSHHIKLVDSFLLLLDL